MSRPIPLTQAVIRLETEVAGRQGTPVLTEREGNPPHGISVAPRMHAHIPDPRRGDKGHACHGGGCLGCRTQRERIAALEAALAEQATRAEAFAVVLAGGTLDDATMAFAGVQRAVELMAERDALATALLQQPVPPRLVTCGLWRHGAAERLAHRPTANCVDPKPV